MPRKQTTRTSTRSYTTEYTESDAYSDDVAPESYSYTHPSDDDDASSGMEYGEEYSKCQDVFFVLLFVAHLVGFAVVAVARWGDTVAARDDVSGAAAEWIDKDLIPIWVGVALLAVVLAFGWLALARAAGGVLIPACMVGYVVLLVVLAAVLAAIGAYFYAVIVLVIAGIYAFFFYRWRDKIPFSKVMLESVVTWVFAHLATLGLAAAILAVLVAFVLLWIVVVSAPLADGMGSVGEFALVTFLLFTLFWTTQVIRNVMHVAVAGTVAAWYFETNEAKGATAASPLTRALRRACTTSLGPVCFGSLVVAVLKTIRSLIRMALNATDNGFIACCINCILSCIESLMELFNQYAFTQVAIFGKSYIRAAKDTWDLLHSHGIAGIINEVLTGLVFFFGALLSALVCAAVAALWASSSSAIDGSSTWITAAIIGFIVAYIIVTQVMEVPDSVVAATFVLLAEKPGPLPILLPDLADAFTEHYNIPFPAQDYRNARRADRRRRARRGF